MTPDTKARKCTLYKSRLVSTLNCDSKMEVCAHCGELPHPSTPPAPTDTKASDVNLLPCPFCGKEVEILSVGRDWYDIKAVPEHEPACMIGEATFRVPQIDEQLAAMIEDWNTRANQQPSAPVAAEHVSVCVCCMKGTSYAIDICAQYNDGGDAGDPCKNPAPGGLGFCGHDEACHLPQSPDTMRKGS